MPRRRDQHLEIQEFGSMVDHSSGSPVTHLDSHTHGLWNSSEDEVGFFNSVNRFYVAHIYTHFPFLNGQVLNSFDGSVVREFNRFPIGHRQWAPDPWDHWGQFSSADLNQYAWRILAETNPSKPHVSVPTALGELKDLPSLVKGWGGNLLQKVAKGHLSWRWALKPMISDLRKLCNFTKAVDQRIVELMHLRDGRTLRRRCHLGTASHKRAEESRFLHSFGANVDGWRQEFFTSETWGTAQWKLQPDSELPQLGFAPLTSLAKRLAAGITTHEALATAWELTPWSWLVDWFSNVGDVIAATNNSIGCTWEKISLMRRTKSYAVYRVNPTTMTPGITLDSDYVLNWVRLERHPVYPVIPVPLPYLPTIDGGKWSILASLAALKRR